MWIYSVNNCEILNGHICFRKAVYWTIQNCFRSVEFTILQMKSTRAAYFPVVELRRFPQLNQKQASNCTWFVSETGDSFSRLLLWNFICRQPPFRRRFANISVSWIKIPPLSLDKSPPGIVMPGLMLARPPRSYLPVFSGRGWGQTCRSKESLYIKFIYIYIYIISRVRKSNGTMW